MTNQCRLHPTSLHNWEDCRQNPRNNNFSHGNSSNSGGRQNGTNRTYNHTNGNNPPQFGANPNYQGQRQPGRGGNYYQQQQHPPSFGMPGVARRMQSSHEGQARDMVGQRPPEYHFNDYPRGALHVLNEQSKQARVVPFEQQESFSNLATTTQNNETNNSLCKTQTVDGNRFLQQQKLLFTTHSTPPQGTPSTQTSHTTPTSTQSPHTTHNFYTTWRNYSDHTYYPREAGNIHTYQGNKFGITRNLVP